MSELINVIIPALILGGIVSAIFLMPPLFKKAETYFKQEDIIDEDKKSEFLLERYSPLYPDKELIIIKPVQNGGQWVVGVMSGKNAYIIMHKVILNKYDFTKISKEGVFKDSTLAILKTYDKDGKLLEEKNMNKKQ